MSEWWTYRPSDFLMFSPATYRRLFELYNADVWPLHLAMLAAFAMLAWQASQRRIVPRFAALALALSFGWIAWAFHVQRYARINWAATYFAAAFAVQAVALGAWAWRRPPSPMRLSASDATVVLVGLAIALLYPWIAVAGGASLRESEVVGIAPDPTAIAALALLAPERGSAAWALRAIPLAACAIDGMLLAAMDAPQAWLVLGSMGAALAFAMWRR